MEFDKIRYKTAVSEQRDISLHVRLKPGNYVIVPSTMNSGLCGKFWITIFYPTISATKVELAYSDPNVVGIFELQYFI